MSDLSQLFTCPRCAQPNFTKRGLTAHVCRKNGRAPLPKADVAATIAADTQGKLSRSERQNAAGQKDCAGPAPTTPAAAVGDDSVGAGSSSAKGVRTLALSDLDVLPPVRRAAKPGAPMPLPEIEENIRDIASRAEERETGYHNEAIYDIAAHGLMLLKAQAQFALTDRVDTLSKRSQKRGARGRMEKTPGGFLEWLRGLHARGKEFPNEGDAKRFHQAKQRAAYRSMQLATNVGLTSDHALTHIEEKRTARELHGHSPSEFYHGKLALEDATAPATPEPAPANLIADALADLNAAIDAGIVLRDEMSPEEFEAFHTALQAGLEKISGLRWLNENEAQCEFGERRREPQPKKGGRK